MACAYLGHVASVPELLRAGQRSFSFELFPPKTALGEENLWSALEELEALEPTFVSVTYGAGGTTRDLTVDLTRRIAAETTLTPVGHLTCVGSSRADLESVLDQYERAGVRNVLALRGDAPGGPGQEWVPHEGGLDHADQLVQLISTRESFSVGVAAFPEGHPESASFDHDARVLRAKQDAGAGFAITQFFFRASDYFALLERATALGVTMPILPGLMPVSNLSQIQRFAELSGADFPTELAEQFERLGDDHQGVVELGIEVATELAAELLAGGSPGLHFYTLNRSSATREIYRNLDLVSGQLRRPNPSAEQPGE